MYIGAATLMSSAASWLRTMPPMASVVSTYRSMGSVLTARISAIWPSVRSEGTLMLDAPSCSSSLKLCGLEGASTADTFHTIEAGSWPAAWSLVSIWRGPGSAIRKPVIPHSPARAHEQRNFEPVVSGDRGHLGELGGGQQHGAAALRDAVDRDATSGRLGDHGPEHCRPLDARDLDPEVRPVGEACLAGQTGRLRRQARLGERG